MFWHHQRHGACRVATGLDSCDGSSWGPQWRAASLSDLYVPGYFPITMLTCEVVPVHPVESCGGDGDGGVSVGVHRRFRRDIHSTGSLVGGLCNATKPPESHSRGSEFSFRRRVRACAPQGHCSVDNNEIECLLDAWHGFWCFHSHIQLSTPNCAAASSSVERATVFASPSFVDLCTNCRRHPRSLSNSSCCCERMRCTPRTALIAIAVGLAGLLLRGRAHEGGG